MPKKIAIIDDSPAFTLLVKQLLEVAEEYRVDAYRTADEFLRPMSRAADYDLIILDLNLPGTYGLNALEQLKVNRATAMVPVLLLSGDSRHNIVIAGRNLGASSFMTKPIEPTLFLERVRSLLGQ